MSKIAIIAGMALVLSAGVALAQPPAASSTPSQPPGAGEHRFEHRRGGPGMGRTMRERRTPEQVKARTTEVFARMDANRDGRVTFDEFRQEQERRRLDRQRRMFQRFSGGQDSFTLSQMNARVEQRSDGGGRSGRGPGQDARPAR